MHLKVHFRVTLLSETYPFFVLMSVVRKVRILRFSTPFKLFRRSCQYVIQEFVISHYLYTGILLMDMSLTQTLRVVHRCASRRGAQRRHQRTGDTHLYHTVLPQVRSQNYYAGELLQFNKNHSYLN